jgi:dTDP-4-dehydrorhamnose reductase
MNVLLTGGTGLLGTALLRVIPAGYTVWATYFTSGRFDPSDAYHTLALDIRDRAAVDNATDEVRPDIIIHTASIGNVDYCETHQEESWRVNVEGTRYLLEAGLRHGSRFIYTSTNAVFDGEHAPYGEEDPPNPIHFYGRTKLASERLIEASRADATIIRPILMYGWNTPTQRTNLVTWLLKELPKGQPVRLLKDVFCNPLAAFQCAEAVWRCVENRHPGCFHIAGRDRVSMYELGRTVAEVFGYAPSLLQPVSRDQLAQLVRRPADTTYRTHKMETVLGIRPLGLCEGLTRMKQERKEGNVS